MDADQSEALPGVCGGTGEIFMKLGILTTIVFSELGSTTLILGSCMIFQLVLGFMCLTSAWKANSILS